VRWDVVLANAAVVCRTLVYLDLLCLIQLTHTCRWTVLGLWRNKLWTDWADDKGHFVYRRRLLHWPRKWLVSWLGSRSRILCCTFVVLVVFNKG